MDYRVTDAKEYYRVDPVKEIPIPRNDVRNNDYKEDNIIKKKEEKKTISFLDEFNTKRNELKKK